MNVSRFIAARLSLHNPRSHGRLGIVLAVIGVGLGVAVMEVALSVVAGFERAIHAEIVGTSGALRVGPYLPFADDEKRPLPRDYTVYDSLRQAGALASATAYIEKAAILQQGRALEGVLLRGVDARWPGGSIAQGLVAGRLPDLSPDSAAARAELLISRRLADRLQLELGARVRLFFLERNVRARPAEVVGIYQTALAEVDNAVVVCALPPLQGILGWKGDEVEGYELSVPPSTAVATLPELALRLEPLIPLDQRLTSVQDRHPEVFDWLSLQHQNVALLLVLMAIVAVVNLAAALLIVITERTRMIGLLKALGAPNDTIQRVFLWQAGVLLGVGLAVGNALALGIIGLQNATGWLRLDPEAYLISTVQMDWVWGEFALANLGVVVVCLLCMTLPVRAVAGVKPVRALRF